MLTLAVIVQRAKRGARNLAFHTSLDGAGGPVGLGSLEPISAQRSYPRTERRSSATSRFPEFRWRLRIATSTCADSDSSSRRFSARPECGSGLTRELFCPTLVSIIDG